MNTPNDLPESLIAAVRYFSDEAKCDDYLASIKWENGQPVCPKCGSDRVGYVQSRRCHQCKERGCRKQFSMKAGTIFEDSSLGLDKWFVAVWCVANHKNGISSHELARALDVQQRSAWFMLHRIREAMKTGTFIKIKGETESDETFVGQKGKNMHASVRKAKIKGRGAVGKTIVHGVLERGDGDKKLSRVTAAVVPDNRKTTVQKRVRDAVEPGSLVCTDALRSYAGLDGDYIHGVVDHAKAYVDGRVHTNSMENFWSLLKRALKGTYVAVAPWHLEGYVTEQAFRFNERGLDDRGRFHRLMGGVVGRRVTYKGLKAARPTTAGAEF